MEDPSGVAGGGGCLGGLWIWRDRSIFFSSPAVIDERFPNSCLLAEPATLGLPDVTSLLSSLRNLKETVGLVTDSILFC